MSEPRCPLCSFQPTAMSDYCEKHRPLVVNIQTLTSKEQLALQEARKQFSADLTEWLHERDEAIGRAEAAEKAWHAAEDECDEYIKRADAAEQAERTMADALRELTQRKDRELEAAEQKLCEAEETINRLTRRLDEANVARRVYKGIE